MFSNNNERKYQCFVCGILFDTLPEMNKHIKSDHNESTDYVVCPACDYAVRDLHSHFRVKHPQRTMPKVALVRATVWRDFKNNKKKTSKPKYKEGYYNSQKCGKQIFYRSGYELKVYECLEKNLNVIYYEAEPFKIPYFYQNKWRNYKPDLLVKWNDGRTQIWEIKPSKQTNLEQNKAKWESMSCAAEKAGYKFVVLTETGIELLRNGKCDF